MLLRVDSLGRHLLIIPPNPAFGKTPADFGAKNLVLGSIFKYLIQTERSAQGTMLERLILLDIELFKSINSHHSLLFDYFFLAVTNLGSGFFLAPILIFLVVRKVPRKHILPAIAIATLGMSLSGIVNNVAKDMVGRPRPLRVFVADPAISGEKNSPDEHKQLDESILKYDVHAPGRQLRRRSFPSGHTNTAFSGATVLLIVLGKAYIWAFLAAVFVGYSRIYLGVHFPADVIVGALMGTAVTALVVAPGMRILRGRTAASLNRRTPEPGERNSEEDTP